MGFHPDDPGFSRSLSRLPFWYRLTLLVLDWGFPQSDEGLWSPGRGGAGRNGYPRALRMVYRILVRALQQVHHENYLASELVDTVV